MLRIKRLHIFVIKGFLGPLLVTFLICMFVFVMQVLWRYVEQFIGKGLDLSVIMNFFYFSAINVVPMALPLAILLASIMSFGNMGEHLELLSIKAAGVSLFRIMRPLLILIVFISVGAFFFSNEVLPWASNKLYSLIQGVKDTKPEVEIPENQFYAAGSITLKAVKKNKETGMLYGLLLYDHSNGQTYDNVTYADSGSLNVTADKKYMLVTLYHGETSANFAWGREKYDQDKIPFRRDKFERREMLSDMKGTFQERDRFTNHYATMNVQRLTEGVDSMTHLVDSNHVAYINRVVYTRYFDKKEEQSMPTFYGEENEQYRQPNWADSSLHYAVTTPISTDSLMYSFSKPVMLKGVNATITALKRYKDEVKFARQRERAVEDLIRRYDIERHRKFTLSFACVIFFFIGAPLGAIIRKGGLGMPVVVSIILFVIYYMVSNTGYKFAREGVWSVAAGMWLSSFFLLPLGFFLTYKAANDSALLNVDTYVKTIKKLFKRKSDHE